MRPNYFESKQTGRKFARLLAISISVVAVCLAVRAAEKTLTLPPETATLKPGPGVDMASQCLTCHSADYMSTQPRLTRTIWKAEVTKMQQKYGAPIPTNTVDRIVDYLTANYGQENPAPPPAAK